MGRFFALVTSRVNIKQTGQCIFTLLYYMDTHLVGVDTHRNTKSTCQAKVSQFDDTIAVDEQILWLQVPVQHSAFVAEQDGL